MSQDYLAWASETGVRKGLPPALAEILRSAGCPLRARDDHMLIFASAGLPVRRMPSGQAWILGRLFDRDGEPAPEEPGMEPSAMPASLTERFWGSYVAFVQSGPGRLQALRDPSGGLPCYHATLDGARVFASAPSWLVDCGLVAAQIDWSEIARSLADRSKRASTTALRRIEELLPGTLLTASGSRVECRSVWNPWDHSGPGEDGDCAERLGAVLSATLGAWGRSLAKPLIEISGGLDSAIAAAGMARTAPGASLITFAAAPGDPDESLYAKALADHLGLPLRIAHPCTGGVDLERSLSADLPRPNARAFTQAADAASLRHGEAIGADAFVSGGGGDDIFCYLRTILPAVDRLHAEGPRAMLSTARDIAEMAHSTLWEALYRIGLRLVRRGPGISRIDRRFLAGDALPAAFGRPRRAPDGDILPGKADHVRGIMTIHNHLEGHARARFAPILSPLLSQPILEACLAVPSWRWCEGGHNRSAARQAFAGRLPQIIIDRRSKGRFDGFCAALLDSNRELVRSMLLEGSLAREGLLDKRAIAHALREPLPSAETTARLLALVDVESWARSWTLRSGRHC